jgi:DnaJ-class molecular chaperone
MSRKRIKARVTACPKCYGHGTVYKDHAFVLAGNEVVCLQCNGTGWVAEKTKPSPRQGNRIEGEQA